MAHHDLLPSGSNPIPHDYMGLLDAIKREIASARSRAALAVNAEMIHLYWRIGRHIVDRQRDEGWGARVIPKLSADLRIVFPEIKGYSRSNLHYMRKFAQAWPDIVQQVVGQIPWGHVIVLLEQLDDRSTRDFYAIRAADEGWSRAELIRQIRNRLHERVGGAPSNFSRTIPSEHRESVQAMVKDSYVLDFLNGGPLHERELEHRLTTHLVRFLQELGVGFAFVGRQYELIVGGEEFAIDLLFYHLRLRRYVVIEVKTVGFAPEHAGKLGFYVNVVDDQVRDPEHDHPTIGILLVRRRNQVVVEYSLGAMMSPLAVSEYNELPPDVRKALPTNEQLTHVIESALTEARATDHG